MQPLISLDGGRHAIEAPRLAVLTKHPSNPIGSVLPGIRP